jgi:hypothetical protein
VLDADVGPALSPPQNAAREPAPGALVESRSEGTRRDDGRHRNAGSPVSSTRTTMGVADAIATLMQQGYSIRLEKKE